MIFTMNDDRMIMEFLSGRYLGYPEAHSIYMNYPFTWLIASLYKIFPSYNWYCITLIGVMSLCTGMIMFRCYQYVKENKKKHLYLIAIVLLLFMIGTNLIALTYSTVAATVGITTLFWYGTSKGTKIDILVTGILAALTWCIRDELFIMILPAAGLIWIFREVFEKKSLVKKMAAPVCVMLCVGICILCDGLAYSSEEWKSFNAYNLETRTEIYDYQSDYYFPNYEENRDYYDELGLSNEERRMLIYSSFAYIQDEISTDTLDKIVEIRGNYGEIETLSLGTQIKDGTKNLIEHIKEGRFGIRFYVGIIGFAAAVIFFLVKKEKKAFLEAVLIGGCTIGIVWAMEVRGRVPLRVADSLSMMVLMMMFLVWIWNWKQVYKNKGYKIIFTIVIAIIGILGVSDTYKSVVEAKQTKEWNLNYDDVRNYCQEHPEDFFVVSIGAIDKYGLNVNIGKEDNRQNNYISGGDWMAYSPVQKERLKQEGISSVAEAMVYDDHVYLISEEDNYLVYLCDYLESRFEKEVIATKVHDLNELYFVYKLNAVSKDAD